MAYVVQLLPDREEARFIRKALQAQINDPNLTSEEEDMAWKYIAQISAALRKS